MNHLGHLIIGSGGGFFAGALTHDMFPSEGAGFAVLVATAVVLFGAVIVLLQGGDQR